MILTDKKINHLSTISHDGKVVFFGTDPDGVVWYSVKRSGFEDSALSDPQNPFGFEAWKKLPLDAAADDPSVRAFEEKNLRDASGQPILRSVYGKGDDVTKTVQAPVQVVSGLGHVYVFRQSVVTNKILASRFVLDGMKNELVPKLDVRFRRSRKRLEAQPPAASSAKALAQADGLDFKDIDGNPFFEPAIELGFIPKTKLGWFSVALVPMTSNEYGRWHVFAYDVEKQKVVLYSIAASEEGLFDPQDQTIGEKSAEGIVYRTVPGIIERTIDLTGLTVVGRPAATNYDVQSERQTKVGVQLVRDVMRVMLVVPVREADSAATTTAALSFQVASDGMLSQIDLTPDGIDILRSDARDVILPLTELDDIKVFGQANPPPSGVIGGMRRGSEDRVEVRATEAFQGVSSKDKVRLYGTRSYDGQYTVTSVNGDVFEIDAGFNGSEPGYWEIVPPKETGLTFDNMVVGFEKTAGGKLRVRTASHDLKIGDQVQLVGIDKSDGMFTVKVVAADKLGFTLDAPFKVSEAVNLMVIKHRGLVFDGVGDMLETPALPLSSTAGPEGAFGRTISVWIKVEQLQSRPQQLVGGEDDLLHLVSTAENKVAVETRLSDGTIRSVVDPNPIETGKWIHYSGTVEYDPATGGNTRIFLCRNGVKVTPVAADLTEAVKDGDKIVSHDAPPHLGGELLAFDGADDRIEVPSAAASLADESFTIELWAKRDRAGVPELLAHQGVDAQSQGLSIGFRESGALTFSFHGDDLDTPFTVTDTGFHHFACTYDATTLTQRIYVDGVLAAERVASAHYKGTGLFVIGRKTDGSDAFKGRIAEVRIWSGARSEDDVRRAMHQALSGLEPSLRGYFPLGNRSASDRSSNKRHGVAQGNPIWSAATFRFPAPAMGAALAFNSEADSVDTADPKIAGNSFSLSFWAKTLSSTGADQVIVCQGTAATNQALQIGLRADGRIFFGFYGNDLDTTATYANNAWHHYTFTYEAATGRRVIYRDGVNLAEDLAAAPLASSGDLRIGRSTFDANPSRFAGCISEICLWDRALTADEAKVEVFRPVAGNEPGLIGYWTMENGQARDGGPRKAHGRLNGEPKAYGLGHFIAGALEGAPTRGFAGEMSDVRIWDRALSDRETRDTMNLTPTGKENDLAGYYRMGGVVPGTPSLVPDFALHGNHAVVHGKPYGGARTLSRATGSGAMAVKYSNPALVAVRQLATYEESFEFRVLGPNPNLDPNDIDGLGNRLFTFSVWGKSSMQSETTIELPEGCVRQIDFQSLGGGYYKASCRITVPEGVSVLRAFELRNVRGAWKSGPTPPADEWTAIEVRRHKLRLVSNTVSRETYTDVVAPVKLTSMEAADADLREAEGRVAKYKAEIADLTLRLDVAQHNAKYSAEKNTLGAQMADLQKQYMAAEGALASERENLRNYRFRLRNRANGGELTVNNAYGAPLVVGNYDEKRKGDFMFEIRPTDGTFGRLARVGAGQVLGPLLPGFLGSGGLPIVTRNAGDIGDWDCWRLDRTSPGVYQFTNKLSGFVLEVPFGWTMRGIPVSWWFNANHDFQRWEASYKELTADGARAINVAQSRMDTLKRTLNDKQARLNYLTKLLATPESATTLQSLLDTARTNLSTAQSDFTTRNNALLATIADTGGAVSMPVVQRDDRNLRTDAGLLDFVRPIGGVSIAATSEGNVQLDYVDSRGRLRNVVYDAAADSRNSTFEQWLPNVIGVCVDCSGAGSMLTPAKPIALPGDGFSFETWFQYPLATKPDGTQYARNVFAGSSDGKNSPVCVVDGNKLGVLVDNIFLDSGVRLDRELVAGWHHLVAVGVESRTDFYLDGVLAGSVNSKRNAICFDGVNDFIEVPPSGAAFAQGITVEAWVYLDNPAEASDWRGIVSELWEDGAVQFNLSLHDADHKLQAGFYDGSAWYTVRCASGLPQGRWVHVAATYDNQYVRIYIDGVLAITSGAINRGLPASATQWRIGRRHDFGNAANMFKGKISEVRIWERVLAEYDIKDGMSKSLAGTEADLVGYWVMETFTENNLTKVKDKTAKEKHGVLQGTPSVSVMLPQCSTPIASIGNMPGGGSPIGRLSELALWHATLSPAEIECMSKMRSSGYEPGLLGFWPLSEPGGETAYDNAGDNPLTLLAVDRVICSANIGTPVNTRKPNTSTLGDSVLALDGTNGKVAINGIDLSNKSFTIEFWAQRPRLNTDDWFIRQGSGAVDSGLHIGFRSSNAFSFAFFADDVDTAVCGDWGWHHWACVFDASTKTQRVYRDGVLFASRTATGLYKGTGELSLGMAPASWGSTSICRGNMGELRIWNATRTAQQIADNMRVRLQGNESGLLGYWPLAAVEANGTTKDLTSSARHGNVSGGTVITQSSETLITPPAPPSDDEILTRDVICADYPTIGVSPAGAKEAFMRRCLGFVQAGQARFLYDARIEPLALQWIGNTQFKPTLLGYIEGPPPVPSENLTMQEDYAGATSVQLVQSDNVDYSWQRSDSTHAAFNMDAFIGAAWSVSAGLGIMSKISEGKAGASLRYSMRQATSKTSAVHAASTVTMSDSLALRGAVETEPAFPHLGRRYVPKNVGYALVISGLADVFITKLARSGRMVGYDIKPVEGVPLDVNTITFMINPAYQLNGSLDGMVGSFAADKRFYDHVPAMRAQYGALYPASYYRLREAYDIAAEIERKDKARETYFMNFDATNVYADVGEEDGSGVDAGSYESGVDTSAGDKEGADTGKAKDDAKAQQKKKQEEAEQRKEAIKSQIASIDGQVRAMAAFAEWQKRMESILTKAGKRNIVNKYVWDADGGLRAETQSFSSSVEHTIGGECEQEGGGGFTLDAQIMALKLELSLIASGGNAKTSQKGLSVSKSMELSVDLSGLESRGITKLDDTPCMPGEKVDRYRFMTFYLEPQTKHFEDFFRTVVDPEWLMSNDEEARALRQTQAGKANRCWRVMHRVTYVERPALMVVGRDIRALPVGGDPAKQMTEYFEGLEAKNRLLGSRINDLEGKLDQILTKLP